MTASRRISAVLSATLLVLFVGCFVAPAAAASTVEHSQLFSRNTSSAVTELTTFSDITSIVRDRYRATVVIFYDSADLNSWRVRATVEAGASLLQGFARVAAADVRNPALAMLTSAWSVSTVPWVYGIGPKQLRPREEFAGAPHIALLGGLRTPVPRSHQFADMTAAGIRKFGLALVAEADLVIQRADSQSQLQGLLEHVGLAATAGSSGGDGEKKTTSAGKSTTTTTTTVVLLTDKASSSLLYRALAATFAQRCHFYEVNTKKVSGAMKALGASGNKVPTLMLFEAVVDGNEGGERKKHIYSGQLNIAALEEFVTSHLTITTTTSTSGSAQSSNTREEHNKKLYAEQASALAREVRRRESPLLAIDSLDDWVAEVEQRAGVVGVMFVPTTGDGDGENNEQKARKAVEQLRDKEAKKKIRSNVVQFVSLPLPKYAAVATALAQGGGEDAAAAPGAVQIFFVSSRKGFATKFVGAVSGDGLYGFMRDNLKRGWGIKSVDLESLRSTF